MKWPPGYRVEPLGSHDRTLFSCGKPPLDTYLRTQVGQDRKRDLTRCYVLVSDAEPQRILGYYTLSSAAVTSSVLPQGHRLPYTEVPCLLLGRLARDESVRGTGLGRGLLLHVLSETARLADEVGIFALLVDALDEEAAGYYRSWDFSALEGSRLFLTVKDIRAAL